MFLIGICSAIEPAVKTTEAIPKQGIVGQIKQNIKQIIPKQGIVGRIKQNIKQMTIIEKILGILFVLALISLITSVIVTIVAMSNKKNYRYTEYFIAVCTSIIICKILLISLSFLLDKNHPIIYS